MFLYKVMVPRRLLLLTGLAAALLVPSPAAAQLPSERMFDAINRMRAQRGLSVLRPAPLLARSAHSHASELIRRDRIYHSTGFLRGDAFDVRSEVLMLHTNGGINVPKVLRGWLASPAHRVVLLDPRWRYLGVGLTEGYFRRTRASMWVARVAA